MEIFIESVKSGWYALLEYLSAHVLTCLVPAFFIAGAIAVFVSKGAILKYFGPKARKWLSYGIASVSGAILAVCSCTILPLFAGIRKRGAGLGPAIAFLYSGPAINILAIVYTARLLGYDLGIARAVGAIAFSIVIGLIMSLIWMKEERLKLEGNENLFKAYGQGEHQKPVYISVIFFLSLLAILVFGAAKMWIYAGAALAILIVIIVIGYKRAELKDWVKETGKLVWQIFPILLAGVFIAGIIKYFLPQSVVETLVGGNSLRSNFLASIFGALMYFSTLTEVPIIKALMDLGMGKGPALTLLLAGPALSLPSMIVLGRIMGAKKTLAYVALVVIMATFTGMAFGYFFG
ncbi:MAG: permease [Actinobacteria bacterium]|nr:permease [Actinomycetota bacterium]MBE3114719.1 permease [Actinomycetota bacterium]